MCIYWTCKYTLCGCIWDMDPSKCANKRLCWGPRMMTLEAHTATCRDCWAGGDKRVSEQCGNIDQEARVSKISIIDCKSDTDRSVRNLDDQGAYLQAQESRCSRPSTPQLYCEIHSVLCPVEEDNNFDLTRACDPVHLASMGRDYRAKRSKKKSSDCLPDGASDSTGSLISCKEYHDEETIEGKLDCENNKGDDFYHSIVDTPVRPESPIKGLEDPSLSFYGSVQEYYPSR